MAELRRGIVAVRVFNAGRNKPVWRFIQSVEVHPGEIVPSLEVHPVEIVPSLVFCCYLFRTPDLLYLTTTFRLYSYFLEAMMERS